MLRGISFESIEFLWRCSHWQEHDCGGYFSKLKRRGYKTELVGEYAKWLWYQNATDIVRDQLYLFAEQVHRLKTLQAYGVEYAVCDSPYNGTMN